MPVRKHWTQTIAGKKRQSKLQTERWARFHAQKQQHAEVSDATDGVGKDMEALKTISDAMKRLSPAGLKYLKQRLI